MSTNKKKLGDFNPYQEWCKVFWKCKQILLYQRNQTWSLQQHFSYIVTWQYIFGGENQSTQRKAQTLNKLLTKTFTESYIEYISTWTEIKCTLDVIGIDVNATTIWRWAWCHLNSVSQCFKPKIKWNLTLYYSKHWSNLQQHCVLSSKSSCTFSENIE